LRPVERDCSLVTEGIAPAWALLCDDEVVVRTAGVEAGYVLLTALKDVGPVSPAGHPDARDVRGLTVSLVPSAILADAAPVPFTRLLDVGVVVLTELLDDGFLRVSRTRERNLLLDASHVARAALMDISVVAVAVLLDIRLVARAGLADIGSTTGTDLAHVSV